jgi:hypothetical protein
MPGGDLVVAGTVTGAVGRDQIVTARLTSAGETVWSQLYAPSAETSANAGALAVDGSGNVWAGGFQDQVDAPELDDAVMVRYDVDGNELGVVTFVGEAGDDDVILGLAADPSGNFYAGIFERVSSSQVDEHLVHYDAAGATLVDVTVPYAVRGLASTADGGLAVAGFTDMGNIVFVRYDGDLVEQWRTEYAVTSNGFGFDVASDADGNVYVAGMTSVVGEQGNAWVGKVDPDGVPLWSMQYNNEEASLQDIASAVAIGSDASVVVAGSETVLGQQTNGWLRRLTQP